MSRVVPQRAGRGRPQRDALPRMIPLPASRLADRAPPARFKSGRRASSGVGRSRNRALPLHSRACHGPARRVQSVQFSIAKSAQFSVAIDMRNSA